MPVAVADAVIEQVPSETSVIVAPLTEQVDEFDVIAAAPDVALGIAPPDKVTVPSANCLSASAANAIVLAAAVTLKVTVTGAGALKVLLLACDALILHVPRGNASITVPVADTVQPDVDAGGVVSSA